MTETQGQELLFDALSWQLAKAQPDLRDGSHRARSRGAGGAFADTAPLLAFPDPRRLDLRRSLTDPFGGMFVRRFERQTEITLHIVVDASASLAAKSASDRHGLAALMSAGLAHAACRGGDRAALHIVRGDQLTEIEPTRRSSAAAEFRNAVAGSKPAGHGVGRLTEVTAALPPSRVLVALISDFELAPAELDLWLDALGGRPVLPIWLRDSGFEEPSPRLGLAELRDPETGTRRTVLTTRKWAAAQAAASAQARNELRGVFQAHGIRPIEIRNSVEIEALIEHLAEASL